MFTRSMAVAQAFLNCQSGSLQRPERYDIIRVLYTSRAGYEAHRGAPSPDFQATWNMKRCHIDLVLYRGFSELTAEASRAYLGLVLCVVEPLLYVGIFYVIFDLGL